MALTAESSGTTNPLLGIWGIDQNNIWAVGVGGTILKWTEAGGPPSHKLPALLPGKA